MHLFDDEVNKARRDQLDHLPWLVPVKKEELQSLWESSGHTTSYRDDIWSFDALPVDWRHRVLSNVLEAFPEYKVLGYDLKDVACFEILQSEHADRDPQLQEASIELLEGMSGMGMLGKSFEKRGLKAIRLDRKYSNTLDLTLPVGVRNFFLSGRLVRRDDVDQYLKHVQSQSKDFRKDRCFSAFKDAVNQATKFVKEYKKRRLVGLKQAKKKARRGNGAPNTQVAILAGARCLRELYEKEASTFNFNVTFSRSQDTKLWQLQPVCHTTRKTQELVVDILDKDSFTKLSKWMLGDMEKNTMHIADTSIVHRAIKNWLDAKVAQALPPTLLKSAPLVGSEREWGSQIFELQGHFALGNSSFVSMADFGVAELRLGMLHETLFVGLPFDEAPGTDFVQKTKFLKTVTLEWLQQQRKGFRAHLEVGSVLGIPPGFIFLETPVNEDGVAVSLRWGALDMNSSVACTAAAESCAASVASTEGLDEDASWKAWTQYMASHQSDSRPGSSS